MSRPQPPAPQQVPMSLSHPHLAPRQPHQIPHNTGQHPPRNQQNLVSPYGNISAPPQQQSTAKVFQNTAGRPQQQTEMAQQHQHRNFNLQMLEFRQSQNMIMQQPLLPAGSIHQPSNAQVPASRKISATSQQPVETDQPPVELHEYTDNGPPADRRKMLAQVEHGVKGSRSSAPQPLVNNRPGPMGQQIELPNHQRHSSNAAGVHHLVPGTTHPILGFINPGGLTREQHKIRSMRRQIQENCASGMSSQGNRPPNLPVNLSNPVGPRNQGIRSTYPQFQVNTVARPSVQEPETVQAQLHRIQTMNADKEKRVQIQEAAKLQLSQIDNAEKHQRATQVRNAQEQRQATGVDAVCAETLHRTTRATSNSTPVAQRLGKRAAPKSSDVGRPTRRRRTECPEILSRSSTLINPTIKRSTSFQVEQKPVRQQVVLINDDGTTRMVEAGPEDMERSFGSPRIENLSDNAGKSFDTKRRVTLREEKKKESDDELSSNDMVEYTGFPPPFSMPEDLENLQGRLFAPLQPVQPMRAGPGLYGESPAGPPLPHPPVDLKRKVNRVNSHGPYQLETWANINFTGRDNPYYWIGFEEYLGIPPIVPTDVLPMAVQVEVTIID